LEQQALREHQGRDASIPEVDRRECSLSPRDLPTTGGSAFEAEGHTGLDREFEFEFNNRANKELETELVAQRTKRLNVVFYPKRFSVEIPRSTAANRGRATIILRLLLVVGATPSSLKAVGTAHSHADGVRQAPLGDP